MADNTEETQPTEGNVANEATNADPEAAASSEELSDEAAMNTDQNFVYWLVMLPFLAIAAVFVYEYSQHPGETNRLINAAGAVIFGIIVASCINVLASEKKNEENGNPDNPNPEGSS